MNKWLFLKNIREDKKDGWYLFGPGAIIAIEPSDGWNGKYTDLKTASGEVVATVRQSIDFIFEQLKG